MASKEETKLNSLDDVRHMVVKGERHSVSDPASEKPKDEGFTPAVEAGQGASAAAVQAALDASSPMPDAEIPPSDLVRLPGGLVQGDKVIRTAIVRELTGRDEELLARASQALNPFHFVNTLLECGVTRFGQEEPIKTKELLKKALIGDRDQLIIGVRRATYGDSLDVQDWECPRCGGKTDLSLKLDDIPVTEMDNPADEIEFDVPRRKGGSVTVRLANGEDQLEVFEDQKLTSAQRDSILLSRCVLAITDADGTRHNLAGRGGTYTLNLSIPDRRSVIKELGEHQPGPRFNDVKFQHEACGNEVSLLIGIGDLFLDL